MNELGKVIEELTYKIQMDKASIWEEKLKLHMKPKPSWMPTSLWAKIVNLVLIQSVERK